MTAEAEYEWYDYRAILSRNALFSIVSGPRSIGKTFGAKRDAVRRFLATGSETIWLRRTHTELTPARSGFFDGVASLWPGFNFRVDGMVGQIRLDGDDEPSAWKTVIRFAALSTSAQMKGTEFPAVDWIVYDECFAEPGQRELPEEVERLRNLWITVNRSRVDRKGRAKTRVLLLGNVTSLDNSWFIEWYFDASKEWQKGRDTGGDVWLHLVDADKYARRVGETIYGKALGTLQLDYGKGGYFRSDGGFVVPERDPNSTPMATLVTLRGTFGLWRLGYDKMFVTVGALTDKNLPTVAFESMAARPGVPLLGQQDRIRRETRRQYKAGRLFLVTPGAMAARQALAR